MRGMKAIVLDDTTSNLRFARAKLGQKTPKGRTFSVGSGSYLLGPNQVWLRERSILGIIPLPHKRYVLLREGDPAPIRLVKLEKANPVLTPANYSADEFNEAISSTLATKFLRGGMDWRILLLLGAGLIIVIQAFALYGILGRLAGP